MKTSTFTTLTYDTFLERYDVNFKARTEEQGLLGVGGFGKVYRGYDRYSNQHVAIKRSFIDKNLLDEVILGQKIPTNRNIARYIEGFRIDAPSDDFDVAIMQYYPAGNLDTLLFKNPQRATIKATQLDSILRGILEGLAFLHKGFKNDKGEHEFYIHRDLKPYNVLIAEYKGIYTPLITDFGISKAFNQQDIQSTALMELSTAVGTIPYKSPEQLLGVGTKYGTNLDLWAFGVMLFKILTGQLPFYSERSQETDSFRDEIRDKILTADLEAVYAQIADQPQKYRQIIRRCLVRDFKQRTQTAQELIDILDEIPQKLTDIKQLVAEKKYDEAKIEAEALLKLRPTLEEAKRLQKQIAEQIDLNQKMSEAYESLESGDFEKAKTLFTRILQLNADNKDAKEALSKCEKQLAIKTLLESGNELLKAKHYGLANAKFEQVLVLEPNNALAKEGIAKCNRGLIDDKPPIIIVDEIPTDLKEEEPTDNAARQSAQIVLQAIKGKETIAAQRQLEVQQSAPTNKWIVVLLIAAAGLGEFITTSFIELINEEFKINQSLPLSIFSQLLLLCVTLAWPYALILYVHEHYFKFLKLRYIAFCIFFQSTIFFTFFIFFKPYINLESIELGAIVVIVIFMALMLILVSVIIAIPINIYIRNSKLSVKNKVVIAAISIFFISFTVLAGVMQYQIDKEERDKAEAKILEKRNSDIAKVDSLFTEIFEKRNSDIAKADSLFTEGSQLLKNGRDKEEVNNKYFREAYELNPYLRKQIHQVLLDKAELVREDTESYKGYLQLANQYR